MRVIRTIKASWMFVGVGGVGSGLLRWRKGEMECWLSFTGSRGRERVERSKV